MAMKTSNLMHMFSMERKLYMASTISKWYHTVENHSLDKYLTCNTWHGKMKSSSYGRFLNW
jgi:hypothetical protein